MTQKPDPETLKALNKNITDEFRANAGKVGGRFEGNELLLLTTTGGKSGEPRVATRCDNARSGVSAVAVSFGFRQWASG